MIKKIFYLLLIFFISGCNTPQKGLWTYHSGGKSTTIDKPNDTGVLETDFGRIKVQPFSVNRAAGFVTKVWIENSSDKAVVYKHTDFKIQLASGEIIDSLDEGTIKSSIEATVADASIIAGGAPYGMQSGVTSDMWAKTKPQLLLAGEVPPNATKTGFVYFPESASKGTIVFRISGLSLKSEQRIAFQSK